MRAFIVALTLVTSVAFCMAVLVFVAGVRPGTGPLTSLALGLYMLAALFAALSALGPKYRATPLLTPTMAGSLAAAAATFVIILGNLHTTQGERVALTAGEPPPPAAAEPAPSEPPAVTFAPETMPPPAAAPVPTPEPAMAELPEPEPTPPLAAITPDMAAPLPPTAEAVPIPDLVPGTIADPIAGPEIAGAPPATDATAPDATVPNAPPLPPIPRRPPDRFDPIIFAEDPFDSSSGAARTGPPTTTALTTPGAASVPTSVTPPLPRSRPCGAGGPPCP